MRIKTSELIGPALDWAAAKCEGASEWLLLVEYEELYQCGKLNKYSTDWACGGPIIEREGIELKRGYGKPLLWAAFAYDTYNNIRHSTGSTGPTPLIAAMRCYVTSKLGDEIEIPKEIIPLYTRPISSDSDRDAERYRWLKKNAKLGIRQNGISWSLSFYDCIAPDHIGQLDAVINLTIKEKQNEHQ